jgi:hypothetical protein
MTEDKRDITRTEMAVPSSTYYSGDFSEVVESILLGYDAASRDN